MLILGIETSCDETALSILEANGGISAPIFTPLANTVLSQIKLHEQYGGVFPQLAKREHARNLVPLLEETLKTGGVFNATKNEIDSDTVEKIKKILEREYDLFEQLLSFIQNTKKPPIDAIAVTSGPGLEPALWVGINFARALGVVWNLPVIPSNHMEGHIVSVLIDYKKPEQTIIVNFPAIALLISGGHTEIVRIKNWGDYTIIGKTRDDAVGEAFDKVARMLDLPYPGGPQISKLAEEMRTQSNKSSFNFPRPMIHSSDFDFSFSGLKTSILYTLKKIDNITLQTKKEIALEFEDAVIDVLTLKVRKAINEYLPKTLIIGGGVIANKAIRNAFSKLASEYNDLKLLIPEKELTTDNAMMIATAAYFKIAVDQTNLEKRNLSIMAEGNLSFGSDH